VLFRRNDEDHEHPITFFSKELRERRSPTFIIMKDDAIYIEGNMISSRKIKQRIYQVGKDKKKLK